MICFFENNLLKVSTIWDNVECLAFFVQFRLNMYLFGIYTNTPSSESFIVFRKRNLAILSFICHKLADSLEVLDLILPYLLYSCKKYSNLEPLNLRGKFCTFIIQHYVPLYIIYSLHFLLQQHWYHALGWLYWPVRVCVIAKACNYIQHFLIS